MVQGFHKAPQPKDTLHQRTAIDLIREAEQQMRLAAEHEIDPGRREEALQDAMTLFNMRLKYPLMGIGMPPTKPPKEE